MAGGKAKTGQKSGLGQHKQHFCPEHDVACQAVKVQPGGMRWSCPKGHTLTKKQVVLR